MSDATLQAREKLVESMGRLAETAGFNRMIGQIYALLYLSSAPLSLGEIAEKLGVSKGSVSLNTRNMERMGMLRRYNHPADRRDFYEADTDFWKVVRGILRDREKKLIGDFKGMLSESLRELKKSPDEDAGFYEERLKHMQDFLNMFSRLLNAYLALEKFRFNLPGQLGGRGPERSAE
jgi:DNA-binding transcriptional regulator GbsR (MarR family)